jgi:hypothetical protein
MWKRLCALCFTVLLVVLIPGWLKASPSQQGENILPQNTCVNCHAQIKSPLAVSSRYFEWHVSLHRDNSVGCEKCHGGDPTTKDQEKSHQLIVLPAANEQSKVHPANLPETCGTCHTEIATAFTGSRHYQKLKSSSLGPTCTTCHAHMASAVVQSPTEAAALCATCHNTINGPLPARPDIPQKAQQVVETIGRANAMIIWADRLLEVGRDKKLDMTQETNQLKAVQTTLKEGKAHWHALNFDGARQKADASFDAGTKVKDQLMKRLYPQTSQ